MVGLSITQQVIELAIFSPKSFSIDRSFSIPVPEGVFDTDGDRIENPALLRDVLSHAFRSISPRPKAIHLSLPGTLLRMVEMPKITEPELYVALSSEAERYKSFDSTEAAVDFALLDYNISMSNKLQQLIFGAVRSDTLALYRKILSKDLKLKIASISLEPLNIFRGMAGTGVLDALIQQIGTEAYWGTVFIEPGRMRISLWQGTKMVEMRETHIDTREFATATSDSIVVEDILEELRRSTKNFQPSIWLTHHMPESLSQILGSRLGIPLRECPLGESLTLEDPNLQVSTVGTAMTSFVSFPFEFNITTTGNKAAGGSGGSVDSGEESQTPMLAILGGAALLVLAILATGIIFAANELYFKGQVASLETKRTQESLELSRLQARERELKEQSRLEGNLLTLIEQAQMRNRLYVALMKDLREKAPAGQLWVHTMSVDNQLRLKGNSLSHQAVINLARSFDTLPYAKAVLLKSLQETMLNGVRVFDFEIGGNVRLDSELLRPPPGQLPDTEV